MAFAPADADTDPGRPRPSSVRPGPGPDWPRPDGCATAGHPLWTSGGRSRPPGPPGRTRAGHRHGRGGRPGVRPGRRPPRPRQHDGPPTRLVRWPDRPGRRGSRRSWSAAAPHRRPAPRPCRGGGRGAHRCRGGGPRTWPGTRPPMLRPAAPGCWRRRRTTGLGLPVAGQILLVVGGQLPGVVLLPTQPRAWRCRPPPRRSPPRRRWRQRTHPWCIALLGRFRVERRANGDASSVMASAFRWG